MYAEILKLLLCLAVPQPILFWKTDPFRDFFSFYLPKLTEVREEFSGFLTLRPRKKDRECGEEN